MQDQYIDLKAGNTLELVCSQPDYGYSAVTQYSAQMSLTEDFAQAYDLESVDKTVARMAIKQQQICDGIVELHGFADAEEFNEYYAADPYEKIYFRAIAQLDGVESSKIVSNVVSYNYIKSFYSVAEPAASTS